MLLSSTVVKKLSRSGVASQASRAMSSLAGYEDFGKNVFAGAVADEYLKKHGSSIEILKNPTWVNTDSDIVANAVFDWCVVVQATLKSCSNLFCWETC